METTETIAHFNELDEKAQALVIAAHAKAFKIRNIATMRKIFDMGNPKIVMGSQNGKSYCRIHEESVEIMKLLIKNYL